MIDKTTIIDFGGMSHANFFVSNNKNDMDTEQKYQFWKYLCLNNIRMIKNKFKPDELIIACDSRSWRKEFFKFYKAHRVIGREKSSIDWDLFYEEIQKFLGELRENFPAYKIIEAEGAEADDIIGIIVNGLRSLRKEIEIISRDHDFRQLIGNNVRLWDPITKKFVQCDSPKEYLLMHILSGDKSDGIPSIVNPDDAFINDEYVYSSEFKKWLKNQDL